MAHSVGAGGALVALKQTPRRGAGVSPAQPRALSGATLGANRKAGVLSGSMQYPTI